MDKSTNQYENLSINSRARNCLIRYLVHFIKTDNYSKIIKPDNFKIEVYSTSDKSTINKIYYSMVIKKSSINPKFDIKKNIHLYEKMNKFFFPLKDECNNRINENEISIKVDLVPSLRNKMFINFEYFNYFYYNGKIFHKFVLKPSDGDILKDDKEKLFIYFNNIENKLETLALKNDLQKLISMKDIWKVLSYIYIIIPVIDKNKAIEIYNKLPDFLRNKKDDNFKISIIYLSDDIKDGETINIFANFYKTKNKNYFYFE